MSYSILKKLSEGHSEAADNGYKKKDPVVKPDIEVTVSTGGAWQVWRQEEEKELSQMTPIEVMQAFQTGKFKTLRKAELLYYLTHIESEATKQALAYAEHRFSSDFADEKWRESLQLRDEATAVKTTLLKIPVESIATNEGE